jgi:beta-glucosidase
MPSASEPTPGIASLPLEERAALCSGADLWHLEAVPSLDLPSIEVADGPHGLRQQDPDGTSVITGRPATCFPTAAALANSWDEELLREVGAAIGREARAARVAVVLGPGVNIKRHPRGGRCFEYLSEDPLLSGRLGAAMVEGIQGEGVGACLKHFAANNQESFRMVVDAIVDERALREIYLASFELPVVRARPWTVMSSYNKLNGTYCAQDPWLLTTVLRDEWGFDGLVMSDWGGTDDRVAGLHAGLDLEMPGSGGVNDAEIVNAVRAGRLAPDVLDRSVERIVALIERSPGPVAAAPPADHDAHHLLAQRAAAESAVLLTNTGLLPLDPARSVAVIGAFATEPRYQGAGSSQVSPTRLDTILDAVTARIAPSSVRYAAGYDARSDATRQDLVDEATLVARSCDVAIVVVGLPSSYEAEGFDRAHTRLPDQHNHLVRAVTEVNPNTVVVLCTGSAVQLPWIDFPGAVLLASLGGQGGGTGVAHVLYGDVNPSGHLAETYAARDSDHGADAWFPGVPRQVQYREGVFVGYRWFDSTGTDVVLPFGHGLSYTTFELADLVVGGSTDADDPDLTVTVGLRVTNTGERAGAEVVQLYVRDVASSVARPDRELKDFAKVHLVPRESRQLTMTLDRRAFAFWDVTAHEWRVEPGRFELLVGTSSRSIHLTSSLELTSAHADAGGGTPPEPAVPPTHEALRDDDAFARRLRHPIPPVAPARPFHRASTVGEIATTAPGALVRAGVLRAVAKRLGTSPDDAARPMFARVVEEAPLRWLVLLSAGRVSWPVLDRLITTLNRFPSRRDRRRRR